MPASLGSGLGFYHNPAPHTTRAAWSGAALSNQDNSTRWEFTYSKAVKFVDVYAHHEEYGLWVQKNVVYHSPHNLGKAKGGKKYRAGQALHDPPGRPVPWSEEGGDGAQVAYTYLGQGTWGQGEVWVRQGDQWVRQPSDMPSDV